jgi:hypothetical protein
MLKFMDGFEQFSGLSSAASGTELAAAGYTQSNAAITAGRTTGSICVVLGGGASTASIARTFTSSASKVVIAFAYMAETARSDILTITNGFTLEWPDKLQINGSKGAITPVLGLWYYYEIVIDKTAETITVWINNVKDLTVALPTEMAFLTTWAITWAAPTASGKRLDDLFFIDNSTGNPIDRVGPQAISIRMPTSDVTKEWSPSTGDDHYALVNKRPAVDTSYIQSATSGAQDTFLSTETVPAAAITAVGVVVRARKADIDDRQIGIVMGPKGGTQKEVLVTSLQTTPTYNYGIFVTDPNNAAWTETSILNTQFGVAVRP